MKEAVKFTRKEYIRYGKKSSSISFFLRFFLKTANVCDDLLRSQGNVEKTALLSRLSAAQAKIMFSRFPYHRVIGNQINKIRDLTRLHGLWHWRRSDYQPNAY